MEVAQILVTFKLLIAYQVNGRRTPGARDREVSGDFSQQKDLNVDKIHAYKVMQRIPKRPHGLQPARLLCPWNSPGKSTGVGSHSLLQGILPDPGIKPKSPALQKDSLPSEPLGKMLGGRVAFNRPQIEYILISGDSMDPGLGREMYNCVLCEEVVSDPG